MTSSLWSSLSLFYVRNGQIPEAEAAGAKAKIISWGGKIRKVRFRKFIAVNKSFLYHHGH